MRILPYIFIIVLLSSCYTSKPSSENSSKSSTINVLDFGADPTGNKDNTTVFNTALAKGKKVFIPEGEYRLDGMVTIKGPLHIEAGTTIIRKKKFSKKTTPMFWLNRTYATMIGEDKTVRIISENRSPKGIVKIGHENPLDNKLNINFCEVRNLFIRGSGREILTGNTGVLLYNSQGNGNTKSSYFHTVSNLLIQQVNTGIHLLGISNANSINNIFFNRVGKSNDDYAIIIEGAQENRIYDVFHHHSKDANTILIKNGTHANTDIKIEPVFNDIFGVISEPGGDKSRCLVAKSGKYNKVSIGCNCKAGFKVYKDYYKFRNSYNTNKGKGKKE